MILSTGVTGAKWLMRIQLQCQKVKKKVTFPTLVITNMFEGNV
jgi:hypothetical protein